MRRMMGIGRVVMTQSMTTFWVVPTNWMAAWLRQLSWG
jgi:hypothetical protein